MFPGSVEVQKLRDENVVQGSVLIISNLGRDMRIRFKLKVLYFK